MECPFHIISTSCQYGLDHTGLDGGKGLFQCCLSLLSRICWAGRLRRRHFRSGLLLGRCSNYTGFLRLVIKIQGSCGGGRLWVGRVITTRVFGRGLLRGLSKLAMGSLLSGKGIEILTTFPSSDISKNINTIAAIKGNKMSRCCVEWVEVVLVVGREIV